MYKEIDELIDVIHQNEYYKRYIKAKEQLETDEKTLALLSRHQILQEDYIKLRKYGQEGDIKKDLQAVKKEMQDNAIVQQYYQAYYALNELLEEVTKIVFQDISDEIQVETLKL